MSALSDASSLDGGLKAVIRELLWAWIDDHGDDIVHLHIWFIKKAFKISQLHAAFAIVLGDHP